MSGGSNVLIYDGEAKAKKGIVYCFTRTVPGLGEYAKYGAFHIGEVPYAYDNLKFVIRPWTDIDYKLANND